MLCYNLGFLNFKVIMVFLSIDSVWATGIFITYFICINSCFTFYKLSENVVLL